MKNFKREFSAGCVVYKRERTRKNAKDAKIKFLLGKHSGYHKWVLPKGLIEEDEKGFEAALRETEEEMGVKAKLISDKPIHVEKYIFYANYKNEKEIKKKRRRVEKYKEEGGRKTKVFKTVSFYLAEYVSGDPKDHGWEMEEGGWYEYDRALELMAFKGEKEALKKTKEKLQELEKQLSLL